MAMNLPTPPTQAPRRTPTGALGSLVTSTVESFFRDAGSSAVPARSGTTPERSAMLPSASTRPGRSAPAEPKRTSFKRLSRKLRGRQAGRADRFELLIREDEFLVAQRLGLRQRAPSDALHQLEDFAAHVIQFGAAQDTTGIHVHVVGHPVVGVGICA